MAAHGWGKSASVAEWLRDEAHRFDFYQAVALIELILDQATPLGEGSEPSREAVRFRSSISLAFPETDIDSVLEPGEKKGDPDRYTMLVNFMGLAGAVGPLPTPFAELLVQRAAKHDYAGREFLDIFNHRLISIAYRIRKQHRVGLGVTSPVKDDAARKLFALMGFGAPMFDDSVRDHYRALLHYAGSFSKETRSMSGLVSILRYHFGVPIEGVQFTGRFYKLDEEELTAIGPNGKNRTIGRGAMLGRRVWDQSGAFEICIGPLSLAEYLRFLPDGDALPSLCEIVRFYAGETFDFSVRLKLKAANVPSARLGYTPGNLLGYTAWIGTARRHLGPPEVRLSCEIIARVLSARTPPGQGKDADAGGLGARG
jgi:type VI secretion system protein ImpH